ncbi:MAG: hypothetical protein K6U04_12380 [Armatimonadetes bacterium]|nr:hypothetical protein [Armatimonadota bacterium]
MSRRRRKKFLLPEEQKKLVITRLTGLMTKEMPEIVFAFLHGSFLDQGSFGDLDLAKQYIKEVLGLEV